MEDRTPDSRRPGQTPAREGKHVDRRVRRSRAAIRAAFLELIMEKEFSQITVKELAERADINRKTFYMHYSSLDDVLAEVEEIYASELERALDRANFYGADADTATVLKSVEETVMQYYDVLRRLASARSLEYIRRKVEHATAAVVEKKLAQYPLLPDALRPYAAQQLASGAVSTFVRWIHADDGIAFSELAAMSATLIFSGLTGLKSGFKG